MKKIYLITYNMDAHFNFFAFHNHILTLLKKGIINAWWHYTHATYIVASDQHINEIYNNILFHGIYRQNLLIIEVQPDNKQGWLPKEAWEWLERYKIN